MKQITPAYDERNDAFCSYCGDSPNTRDHVPSKILLDEPFPENLPVVPCCYECNNKISLDEEFIACIIECMVQGSCEIDKLKNKKIKEILKRKTKLYLKIKELFIHNDNKQIILKEHERFKNVIIKLAKGHWKYETGDPLDNDPDIINVFFLKDLSESMLCDFLSSYNQRLFPEVGSRKLIRTIEQNQIEWVIVQDNIYKYLTFDDGLSLNIKIIIREFIAFEIKWNSNL
jgi:hypothetical protein